MTYQIVAKQIGLLHELLPGATRFGLLINPRVPNIEAAIHAAQAAAAALGRPIEILAASTNREIDTAFASVLQKGVDALVVSPGGLFVNRRVQITTLTSRHAVPTIFTSRQFVDVGGLMSYTSNPSEQYQQVGLYVGRILKGQKPSELPVMQPTKFEFVINLQTARTLGIEAPEALLAQADEVIE
jgi:putative ABC transport system substrate-binding protein